MRIFKISETIRRANTADGVVLLDVHYGQMFRLNIVGSKILELLRQGNDEIQIADEISKIYGANREIIRADVIEFIDALETHHILQQCTLNESPLSKCEQQVLIGSRWKAPTHIT